LHVGAGVDAAAGLASLPGRTLDPVARGHAEPFEAELARRAVGDVVAERLAPSVTTHGLAIARGLFICESIAVLVDTVAALGGLFQASAAGAARPLIHVSVTVLVDPITGLGVIPLGGDTPQPPGGAHGTPRFTRAPPAGDADLAGARLQLVTQPVTVVVESVAALVLGLDHGYTLVGPADALGRPLGTHPLAIRETGPTERVHLVVDAVAVVIQVITLLRLGGADADAAQGPVDAGGAPGAADTLLAGVAGLVGVHGALVHGPIAVVVQAVTGLVLDGGRLVAEQRASDADRDPIGAHSRKAP
jgi:hypothetical protein